MPAPLLIGVSALATPAYAAAQQTFSNDQSRLIEIMAPHLGRMVGAVLRGEQRTRDHHEPRVSSGTRDLRIVFSR